LQYNSTIKTEAYLKIFNRDLNDEELRKKRHLKVKIKFSNRGKLNTLYRSFFDTHARKIVIRGVINKFKRKKRGNFNSL
jgi:hypothetical protein